MAGITIPVKGDVSSLLRSLDLISKTPITLRGLDGKSISGPLGKINGELGEFEKSLNASNARVLAFGASAGIISLMTMALKESVVAAVDVEKKLTEINSILGVTGKEIENFGNALFSIAKNTGSSFSQVATAANELARQGLGVEDTLKRTSDALILTRLTGLNAVASIESITAALNSFANEALTSSEVINKLAAVDASFAVSGADLAEALKRVGSSASDAGVDINQLLAIVTAAQQTTSRGGAVIGNSFKTIFTRLQRPKVLDQLEELGIATHNASGASLGAIQVLSNLANVFDTLSAAQQSQVAELVGGVYQINILKASLSDLGKQYSIYGQALNISNGATNEAERRNDSLNQTLSANLTQTVANLTKVGASIASITLGPAMKKALGGLNAVLESYEPSDTESTGQKIGKGVLRGIGSFLSGGGMLVIGLVIFRLLDRLRVFASDAFKSIAGLNAGSSTTAQLQEKVFTLLSQQPALMQKIADGSMTIEQAHSEILRQITAETAALELQLKVSRLLAESLAAGGAPPGAPPGGPVTTSRGFVPNFNPFSQEEKSARRLGAANPTAHFGRGTIGGKPFVMNNRETEVPGFGKNGDSLVLPNYGQVGKDRRKELTKSSGFVPNFAGATLEKTAPAKKPAVNYTNLLKDNPNLEVFTYRYKEDGDIVRPDMISKDAEGYGTKYEAILKAKDGGLQQLGFSNVEDLTARFSNSPADFFATKSDPYLLDAKVGWGDPKVSAMTDKLRTMNGLKKSKEFSDFFIDEKGYKEEDLNRIKMGIVFGNAQERDLRPEAYLRQMDEAGIKVAGDTKFANTDSGKFKSQKTPFSEGFVPNFAKISDITRYKRIKHAIKNSGQTVQSNDVITTSPQPNQKFSPNIASNLNNNNKGLAYEKAFFNQQSAQNWKRSDNLAFGPSSAIDGYKNVDAIAKSVELLELKSGRYSEERVADKFLRAIPENHDTDPFKGFFTTGVDTISVNSTLVTSSEGFVPNFEPASSGTFYDFDETLTQYPPDMDKRELFSPESIKKASLSPLGEKLVGTKNPINVLTAREIKARGPIEEFLTTRDIPVNKVLTSGSMFKDMKTRGARGPRDLNSAEKKAELIKRLVKKYQLPIHLVDDADQNIKAIKKLNNPLATAELYEFEEQSGFGQEMPTANAASSGFIPNFGKKRLINQEGGASDSLREKLTEMFASVTREESIGHSAFAFEILEGNRGTPWVDQALADFEKFKNHRQSNAFSEPLDLNDPENLAFLRGQWGSRYFKKKIGKKGIFDSRLTPGARPTAASGFVPNFNNEALSSAMSRENKAGIPRSEIRVGTDSSLATSKNPQGLGVFNKEEGSLENGINLAKAAGINPKTKGSSKGFVPNFAGKYSSQNIQISIGKVSEHKKAAKRS